MDRYRRTSEAKLLHLRIIVADEQSQVTIELLESSPAVVNLVVLEGAARQPGGDVILCDVVREAASVVLGNLKDLGIPAAGSIAVEAVDIELSDTALAAARAAPGSPADAVVWEEVEAKTSESTEISASYLIYMAMATVIASVGIMLDNPILIVGAMVVGPEFGPLSGLCVAIVQRRGNLALRSFAALAIGFPVGITAAWLATLAFKATGTAPEGFSEDALTFASLIAHPDAFSVVVALCAGVVGMLSLTAAKSSVLVGVLVSVTTIPAAANIGVAVAYADWSAWRGSQAQLAINLLALVAAGLATLLVQRLIFKRRMHRQQRPIEDNAQRS